MEILILLAGAQIGPFSEKQVREYLADGLISLSDQAKYAGMEEWATVESILAQLAAETSPVADDATPKTMPEADQATLFAALPFRKN